MAYEFNHVHIKAPDPEKTANWYVEAFNFRKVSDTVRQGGNRFIRCETHDGTIVNISGARTNQPMRNGDVSAHWGLEHFGLSVDDLDAEIERLKSVLGLSYWKAQPMSRTDRASPSSRSLTMCESNSFSFLDDQ